MMEEDVIEPVNNSRAATLETPKAVGEVTADVYDEFSICCNCGRGLSRSCTSVSDSKMTLYAQLPLTENPFADDNLLVTKPMGSFLCTTCRKDFQGYDSCFLNAVRM